MILLTFLLAIGCTLSLPHLAMFQLERDGATEKFEFSFAKMTVASAVGACLGVAISYGTDLPTHVRFLMVAMCSFLALSAWIDRIAAWAPDTVMVPICLLVFLVSGEISSIQDFGILLAFGIALFLGGLASWIPQEVSGYRVAPPADIVAIATPFILFGISPSTVVTFLATAILLLAALKVPGFALIFSRPEAVADASDEVNLGEKPAVTFLSVIFPVLLCVLLWHYQFSPF